MKRPIRISLSLLVGFLAASGLIAQASAQSSSYISTEESDPRRLGWMEGFPPPIPLEYAIDDVEGSPVGELC